MIQLVVLFLVAAGEAHTPRALAMKQAVDEVLASSGEAVLREAPPDRPDAAAIDEGRALNAVAVVRVRWMTADHPQVELRVHRARAGTGWVSRVLGFDQGDDPQEMGRAIGYSVLAMLPEVSLGAAPLAATRAHPADETASVTPAVTAEPRLTAGAGAQESAGARPGRHLLVDAVGAASAGVGGFGGGWGGGLRAGWEATPRLRIGGGAVGRIGEIAPARATTLTLSLTAGMVAAIVLTRRFTLAVRAEALVALQAATRFATEGGGTVRQSRWVPGGDAAVEAAVWLSAGVALVAAAGLEVVAGHTDVFAGADGNTLVAVIPSSRIIGEAGLRVRF